MGSRGNFVDYVLRVMERPWDPLEFPWGLLEGPEGHLGTVLGRSKRDFKTGFSPLGGQKPPKRVPKTSPKLGSKNDPS